MKKWLIWLIAAFLLAAGGTALAEPKIPPPPTSSIYVQDYAGVLNSDTEASINSLGARLTAATKAQVVVVTVKSLEGENIEQYALALLRGWGIGDKQLNNGVLLLVAVNDRQSRIEVGYGLEGALPDAKTGRIQDEYMIPHFQKGDYSAGIWQGYRVLVRETAAEYKADIGVGEIKPAAKARDSAPSGSWDSLPFWAKALIGAGIVVLLLIDWMFFGGNITMLIIALLSRRRPGGGGGGYGGGSGGGGGSSRRW